MTKIQYYWPGHRVVNKLALTVASYRQLEEAVIAEQLQMRYPGIVPAIKIVKRIKPKPKQTDGREIGGKGGGDPRPIQPDLPFMDEKELVAIGAKNPVWTYRVNKKGCPYIIARLKYLSASRSVIAGDKHSMKRLRKKREEMLFGEMEPHLVSEVLDEVKRLEPKLYAPLLELAELLLIFEDITDCRQACIEGMVVIADLYPRFNRGLQSSIEAIVKPKDTSL